MLAFPITKYIISNNSPTNSSINSPTNSSIISPTNSKKDIFSSIIPSTTYKNTINFIIIDKNKNVVKTSFDEDMLTNVFNSSMLKEMKKTNTILIFTHINAYSHILDISKNISFIHSIDKNFVNADNKAIITLLSGLQYGYIF